MAYSLFERIERDDGTTASDRLLDAWRRSEIKVLYLSEPLREGEPLLDSAHRAIVERMPAEAVVFLVDFHPDGNWEHDCWIALCPTSGPDGLELMRDRTLPPLQTPQRRLLPLTPEQVFDETAAPAV